jgi:hypothetical protein
MATATPPPPVAGEPKAFRGPAKLTPVPPAFPIAPFPDPNQGVDEHPGDRIALIFWMVCFVLLTLMVLLDPMLALFR